MRLLSLSSIFMFLVFNISLAGASNFSNGNIIVATDDNEIYEFTRDGQQVQQQTIPTNSGCCEKARDLILTAEGKAVVYNGTFTPLLSIYDSEINFWTDLNTPGWSTANNASYGGIAVLGTEIYVTDMATGQGGEAKGIVRFNLADGSSQRYLDTTDYIDITTGLDGKLYALQNTYGDLDVIDPQKMTVERSLDLGHTSASRAVTANAAGEIFMASWDGSLYHYDNSGTIINSLAFGSFNLIDVDINNAGDLIVGSRFGDVFVTDESLLTWTNFSAPGGSTFVAFADLASGVTPWQDNANGTLQSGINWDYAMGYHFTPQKNGHVTDLGGFFSGNKYVRLFNKATGELLAETLVSAANEWSYAAINPVQVDAGTTYTVAVYLAGSGGSYYYGNSTFPQTYGDITIEGTTYAWTGNDPDAPPTITWTSYMLGQADIVFSVDETGEQGGEFATICSQDTVPSYVNNSGIIPTGPSADLIALCSGWVLQGNVSTQNVEAYNVFSGEFHQSYLLDGVPVDLELYDDILFVAQESTDAIEMIDFASGQQNSILTSNPAVNLAAGQNGNVFATLAGASWWESPIVLINANLGEVDRVYPGNNGENLLVFNRLTNQLIAADTGLSPSSLVRYNFDQITNDLFFDQELVNAGGNGQDLALSVDGNHLAFAAGAGNGAGYTIFDFFPEDYSVVGEWNTGAYPRAVAFSPDSLLLAASNGVSIKVFRVSDYTLMQEFFPDLADCSYSQINKVAFSQGGEIIYGFSNCGFNDDSGRIFWGLLQP